MEGMFKLTKRVKFEAAHRIPGHPGKCDRLHGHTYLVDIEVSGDDLDSLGILIDFSALKELEALLPDHTYLNESLPGVLTTAEGLSRHFFQQFRDRIPQVTAVTVHEGPNSWCRYEESAR
jgi:6-pyruvoyltetrahydropterin/6-carboxytetrahydropterin synthase